MQQAARGAAVCAAYRLVPKLGASVLNARGGEAGPRALVLIHLEGGNDGLNTLVPFQDDGYYRARPTLAIPRRDVIALSETVGLNRAGQALEPLFKAGKLAIVQNVGYAGQSNSHFRSSEIWQTASAADEIIYSGWVGRCFSHLQSRSRAVTGLYTPGAMPRSFVREEDHPNYDRRDVAPDFGAPMMRAPLASAAGDPRAMLGEVAERAAASSADEIYFVSVPGFDTHFRQAERHRERLQAVSDALLAFQQRVEQRGVGGRVLTLVYSEFGRSLAENAQGGTDHGESAPLFLLGQSINGGLRNDGGATTMDFRKVVSTISDRWLNVPPRAVIPSHVGNADSLNIFPTA